MIRQELRKILLNLYKHTESKNCPECKEIDEAIEQILVAIRKESLPEKLDKMSNPISEIGVIAYNQAVEDMKERLG